MSEDLSMREIPFQLADKAYMFSSTVVPRLRMKRDLPAWIR